MRLLSLAMRTMVSVAPRGPLEHHLPGTRAPPPVRLMWFCACNSTSLTDVVLRWLRYDGESAHQHLLSDVIFDCVAGHDCRKAVIARGTVVLLFFFCATTDLHTPFGCGIRDLMPRLQPRGSG